MEDGWGLARGLALAAMVFAAIGTWPVCALLLALYRRAVHRGMQVQLQSWWPGHAMSTPAPPLPHVEHYGSASTITVVEATAADAETAHWLTELRRRSARTRWAFGLAALGYGLAAVVVTTVVSDWEWRPVRSLAFLVLLAWPALPTALSLSTHGRRVRGLLVLGWVGVVVALLMVGGLPPGQVVLLILLQIGIPVAYVVLTTGVRYLRGAAWLVAPGLAVLGLVVMDLALAGYSIFLGLGLDPQIRPGLVRSAVLLVRAAGLRLGHRPGLRRQVGQRGVAPLVLQWWVVAALWSAADAAMVGLLPALLGLTPLVVLVLILLVTAQIGPGRRGRPDSASAAAHIRRPASQHPAAARAHQAVAVDRQCQTDHRADVATETLEPDCEFLDFIPWRPDLARLSSASRLRCR